MVLCSRQAREHVWVSFVERRFDMLLSRAASALREAIFNCCFSRTVKRGTAKFCMERAAGNHSIPLMWSSNMVNPKQQCLVQCKAKKKGPRSITELLIATDFNVNPLVLCNYFAKCETCVGRIQTPRPARVELKQGPHQRLDPIRKDRGPAGKPNGPEMIAHNSSK